MATRSKAPEKAKYRKRAQRKKKEEPKVIRKAIYLSALIYVEGDQPAPEDFAKLALSALEGVLTGALEGEHDGLQMALRSVEVRNDIEEDEEDKAEEQKFQF